MPPRVQVEWSSACRRLGPPVGCARGLLRPAPCSGIRRRAHRVRVRLRRAADLRAGSSGTRSCAYHHPRTCISTSRSEIERSTSLLLATSGSCTACHVARGGAALVTDVTGGVSVGLSRVAEGAVGKMTAAIGLGAQSCVRRPSASAWLRACWQTHLPCPPRLPRCAAAAPVPRQTLRAGRRSPARPDRYGAGESRAARTRIQ